MRVGTKSVLFGVHQFLMHPLTVAAAWVLEYGLESVYDRYVGYVSIFDPRLWMCFFVHDLGYLGKENMDGLEGKLHPLLGGKIMGKLFGSKWRMFCVCHSGSMCDILKTGRSRLHQPDKRAMLMWPEQLYISMGRASGEIYEYMSHYSEYPNGSELEWLQEARRRVAISLEAKRDEERLSG